MKYLKIVLTLLLSFSLMTCERDDLCPETTPTTPSLIIEFYDNATQESQKNVFDLVVGGIGNDSTLPGYTLVDTAELILPLKTDTNITQYALISDTVVDTDGTITAGNQDIITITYETEDIYVSRACGYKTIFKNVVITVDPGTDGNWIIFTEAINDNLTIEDETTTHYYFYH
ncbi:MAG: DUF6452 family protein [Olleya sp.]